MAASLCNEGISIIIRSSRIHAKCHRGDAEGGVYPTIVGWKGRPGQADIKEGETHNVPQDIDGATVQYSSTLNNYRRVDDCGRMLIGL